jgi:hypothetical protein
MSAPQLHRIWIILGCLWRGHDKTWDNTIFTPTWTCRRCGRSGDLQAHSRMALRQHALALIPTLLIGILLWLLLF